MPPRPRFDRRAPVRELPNINERIGYPNLRVVDADGSQLGVITREAALEVARDRELDLVLVSEKADVKEVKMRYKIDDHDYQVRIGQAVRFLKSGDKVKCTVIFRGREIQHTALAEQLLLRMAQDLGENAEIQQPPKREGRNMIMFLSPRKAAITKTSSKPTRSLSDSVSSTSASPVAAEAVSAG